MGKGNEDITQNVTKHYLKKAKLQQFLEKKFPGREEFNIQMRDDQYTFTAPEKVDETELETLRDING